MQKKLLFTKLLQLSGSELARKYGLSKVDSQKNRELLINKKCFLFQQKQTKSEKRKKNA